MRKTRGVPLLQLVRGETLTVAAPEVMLAVAEVISEGFVDPLEGGDGVYNGSTLFTINLRESSIQIGIDRCNLDKLKAAASRSLMMHIGLLRMARLEAERRCAPSLIREMSAETEFRIEGERLLVDINVACALAKAVDSGSSGEGSGT